MLIGIVGAYMFNYIYYTRQHILKDGSVITHTHPYNKSDAKPFKEHHHSKPELLLYNLHKILFVVSAFDLILIAQIKQKGVYKFFFLFNDQYCLNYKSIRAPPSA